MYSKIVVPLDGSALAEQALPYAVKLATRLNGSLLLMRAIDLPPLVSDTPDHELQYIETAENYLDEVSKTISDPTVEPHIEKERVQTLVVYGEKAKEIAEIAPFEKADLVVMTTHGRTGLSRLIMGSVAAKIIQISGLPVVLIRPKKVEESHNISRLISDFNGQNIMAIGGRLLVTLDGTPEAEAALEPACEMAQKLGLTLYLLQVVKASFPVEVGYFGPGYIDSDEAKVKKEEAYSYLDQVQARLAAKCRDIVKAVRVGDPVKEIVDYSNQIGASMLVMVTHARGTIGRYFIGSVSEEVMRQTHLPVMMVHPHVYAKTPEAEPVRTMEATV